MLSLAALLSVVPLLLFAWAWNQRRAIFLLPSTWVMLLSTLIYVVPAVLFFEDIEDLSPYAVTALTYCSIFVTCGLLVNLAFGRPPSIALLLVDRRTLRGAERHAVSRALRMVLFALACITLWYLMNVPLRSTGLYGVIFDPENAAQLREESLKLLDIHALQYLYLVGFSALSPLAFTLLLVRGSEMRGARRWALILSVGSFLVFYLLLTGARVGLVNLALAGVLFAFLRNRMRLGLKPVLAGVLILLSVPMLLSFLREQGRNEATVLEYAEAIGERIFLLPLLISGWFVEYAQTHGAVGLDAAIGLGPNVDWSNVIALEFLGRKEAVTIETVTTPTAFFFSNYLYFGWFALLPSLIALQLIDLPMRRLHRVARPLRLPFAATMLFFSVIFVQSGFGVTLISHGYMLLILLVLGLPAPGVRRPAFAQ